MKRLKIQSAEIRLPDLGHKELVLEIEGHAQPMVLHDLKNTVLQLGLVPLPDGFQEYAGDFTDYQGEEEDAQEVPLSGMSNDPVLVELARLFASKLVGVGPLTVPSHEEALATHWEIDPWRNIFRKID